MSIAGYNFYLNGSKVTDVPQPSPTYTYEGLASNSAYNLQATAVDTAGLESPLSAVLPASTLAAPTGGGPVSAEHAAAIDAIVAASMADPNSVPQGVIVQVNGPAGKYTKAYGTTGSRPINTDDHFRVGSITKMFVALAAWRQIDAGTLSLDDTIEQYVPGIPLGTQITIAQIMSMRSGIYDFMASFFGWQIIYFLFPTSGYTEAQALSLAKGNPSQFAPGSQYAYCNSNAVIIGAVLEKITGRDIRTILHEDVIEPLGLTETEWPGYPAATSTSIQEPNMGNWAFNPDLVQCAGSLTSNITDLTRFAEAMRDGDLISNDSWNTWFHDFPTVDSLGALSSAPSLFGYGYFMMSYGRWFGHGGSCPGGNGYVTACLFDPLTGATITVAENKQTANASAFYVIGRNIADLLYPGSMISPTYPIPRDVVAQPAAAAVSVTGGTPTVTVEPANKIITPAPAVVTIVGGTPGSNELQPAAASVIITPGTPTVAISKPVLFNGFASGVLYYGYPLTLTHTAADGDLVMVDVMVGISGPPTSVTYGGEPMTLVDHCYFAGGATVSGGVLSRYAIADVAAGDHPVVVNFAGLTRAAASARAYSNVGSIGETTKLNGPGTGTPSQSVSPAGNQLIVHAFGEQSGAAFSSWSGGTNRGHAGTGDIGGYADLIANDTNTPATFTAAGSSGMYWGGLATALNGAGE